MLLGGLGRIEVFGEEIFWDEDETTELSRTWSEFVFELRPNSVDFAYLDAYLNIIESSRVELLSSATFDDLYTTIAII